jgi:hypothetical protein
MKLKDCKYGMMVEEDQRNGLGRIGFIVGLTYNVDIKFTGKMSDKELRERTIVKVAFPENTVGIHPANIKPFK